MKRCWQCAEQIQDAAAVCRYCQATQGGSVKLARNNETAKTIFLSLVGIVALTILANAFGLVRQSNPTAQAAAPAKSSDPYGGCIMKGLNNKSQSFAWMVKEQLRNPDSFDHVSTDVGAVKDGVFPVAMTYRATNGFGAIDTKMAGGQVRVSDCAARVFTVDGAVGSVTVE